MREGIIYCNCGAKFRSVAKLKKHDHNAHMRRLKIEEFLQKARLFGLGFAACFVLLAAWYAIWGR